MVRRSALAITVLCALHVAPQELACQQTLPRGRAAIREILTLQDQRSVSDGRLIEYLASKDGNVRSRAALALANVADTSTVLAVIPLLADASREVRESAAFALGQIGDGRASRPLQERLSVETSAGVSARILEALGKCGPPEALESVISYRPGKGQPVMTSDQALSVARFAIRSLRSKRSIEFVASLLDDSSSGVQWTALYALWRSAPDSVVTVVLRRSGDRLKQLARSKNPDVRRNLALLTARVQSKTSRSVLRELDKAEGWPGDWRVRTEIARALAAHVSSEADFVGLLARHLEHRSANVRLAAMAALGGADRRAVSRSKEREALVRKLDAVGRSVRERDAHRSEAMAAMARLFPEDYKFIGLLDESSTPVAVSAGVIRSFSSLPSRDHVAIVLERLGSRSLPIAMAAWETLPPVLKPAKKQPAWDIPQLAATIAKSAKAALLRNDMALTTLVAQAIADTAVMTILNAEGALKQVTEDLMLAYAALASPGDVEAMQAVVLTLGAIGDRRAVPVLERALKDPDRTVAVRAAASLKQITGSDYSAQVAQSSEPLYTDYDWKSLESVPELMNVELLTNRGLIVLELLPREAPFTVLSFVKLVRKGFYDGLLFHRVVPDFVVQGGDPRGDGWGGPGYAIRTETALVNYYRGMVGIASAGKDTEGCQFFITHSAQPHLDGRYTIFARVREGMSVVDAIQVGDSITRITIKN
jgi:cyclophilin family peptidyl-prolyl cis-trans isomerase